MAQKRQLKLSSEKQYLPCAQVYLKNVQIPHIGPEVTRLEENFSEEVTNSYTKEKS